MATSPTDPARLFSELDVQYATSADDTPIAFYDFGGDGPDLLLAHASGFCAAVWAPVVAHLRTRFRCIAYDTRGHGLSGRPTTSVEIGWHWDRFGEDVAAVIETARLERPHGVGHSSGGASVALLEERCATFRSLYLFEPVIFAVDPPAGPDPERDLAVRTRRRRTSFASREEALEAFSSRGPFVPLDRAALEAYVDHGFAVQPDGALVLRCAPNDEAEVYVQASAHDGYGHLPSIGCPTTFGHGETSTSFTASEVRHLSTRVPRGAFEEFAGWGHFGPLEHPKGFADAVATAIDQQRPGEA